MFYIIGLGLGDVRDITVKGLEIVKKCDKIYLEAYTSILMVNTESLEDYYGKKIEIADRELVEQGGDDILAESIGSDVALLVVGDPFGATTHIDLVLRAKQRGIKYQVVHNASILNAVGCTGLQLYSFGETVSIPFWTDSWEPDSFFEKIISNYTRDLHTLCLLDIRVKEPTLESITKKKREYEPPRFMSVNVASEQIIKAIRRKQNSGEDYIVSVSLVDPILAIGEEVFCVGVARVGSEDQKIVAGPLNKMCTVDLGKPLHSLIITAKKLHPLEDEYVGQFMIK